MIKKLLLKTLSFIGVTLLLLYLFQYVVDNGLRKFNSDIFSNYSRLFNSKINSDILILGNSRAMVNFDPRVIENVTGMTCYNLSVDGSLMGIQKAVWQSYLKYNRPPKILIQTVDLQNLAKDTRIYNKVQFMPYLNEAPIYNNLKDIDKNLYVEKYLPMYKYRGFLPEIIWGTLSFFNIKNSRNPQKIKGFIAKDKKWNKDFESFKEKLKGHNLYYKKEDISYGIDYLNSLIQDSKKYGFKLIMVNTPQYYKLQEITVQKDSVSQVLGQLADNENAFYLDYTWDSLNFDKAFFYNSMHLNKLGSTKFSYKYATDLEDILQR